VTVGTRLQLRRNTAANWATDNPVLLAGELGVETDTGSLKVGDGTSAWNILGYANRAQIAALSATYAPLATPAWAASTAYAAGQHVLNPSFAGPLPVVDSTRPRQPD
jgi:hypothetical protein